ncbi:hypothetical protein [Sorangium sp. So ce145]|uniref:hypothetical protein n=1 Tax=Sorangium sp. So ce145 TaxID=3133285 RepID=UPI003F5ED0FE
MPGFEPILPTAVNLDPGVTASTGERSASIGEVDSAWLVAQGELLLISARRYELPLVTAALAHAALQLAEHRNTIFPTAV